MVSGGWPEDQTTPGSLNLDQLENWEDYRDLLADGSYLQRALNGFTDLSTISAIVYQFTDAWGEEESKYIPNPTIRVMFNLDYANTTVISYGFDLDNGITQVTLSPDVEHYALEVCKQKTESDST